MHEVGECQRAIGGTRTALRAQPRTPPRQGTTGSQELSMVSPEFDRRIPDEQSLRREVDAWQDERNAQQVTVDWQFTTEDARTKLKRLYPCIHE